VTAIITITAGAQSIHPNLRSARVRALTRGLGRVVDGASAVAAI
jgi:hypothetical protein